MERHADYNRQVTLIREQGDLVRKLKREKADRQIIRTEVDKLLDLKAQLKRSEISQQDFDNTTIVHAEKFERIQALCDHEGLQHVGFKWTRQEHLVEYQEVIDLLKQRHPYSDFSCSDSHLYWSWS